MYQAVQFIGTQRSGSNLLRIMLDRFEEVFGPHPPHILIIFYPLLKYYGNLESSVNFKKLIDDVCCMIELNPVPWNGVGLDREKIFENCRRRTLLEIFIQINEFECRGLNKKIWSCKSMESLYLLNKYREEGFDPLYLYLFRDGRDVALSFKKAIVGEKHIYNLALKWKADQDACLKELESLDKARYVKIKYEDFVSNSEIAMKEICSKLGIEYKNVADDFYKSEESQRTAAGGKMWENVTKPIIKDNYGKFLKELSEEEILIFETVAGDTLEKLGYKLYTSPSQRKVIFSDEEKFRFNEENALMKKEIVKHLPVEDILKRKPQSDLIEQIRLYDL